MIELSISKKEEGRTLQKFMEHLFPAMPKGFLYKALRQNKIKVDRKRPKDVHDILKEGSVVQIYLTDEQVRSFGFHADEPAGDPAVDISRLRILYEDDQLLIVDKPVGTATQKGASDPVSLTEIARSYLRQKGDEGALSYRPSFCHRLDKNTAGALIMAKTLPAHHAVDELIQKRKIHKYYLALVTGVPENWREETLLRHGHRKDREANKAALIPWSEDLPEGYVPCMSRVRLISTDRETSLVKVELITGKSHQIRAQLAYEGYPILGDGKYQGGHRFRQALVAAELWFEDAVDPIAYMKGKRIRASLPDIFSPYQ